MLLNKPAGLKKNVLAAACDASYPVETISYLGASR